jgi:AcrR family transcriptional regulator
VTPTRTRTRAAAQQRRAATEQAILDATEALLETRPYRELTVEDVMEAAGLSRTAFYRYFPDLETVLLRHMTGIADEIALASYHWLTAEDPDAQLVDAGLRIAAVYREHGRVMQAFSDAAGAGPDVHEAWRATIDRLIEPGVAHLRLLIAHGRAECDYPDETIRALSVLIDRYMLDIYGRSSAVDIAEPVAVLLQIWRRTLRLR